MNPIQTKFLIIKVLLFFIFCYSFAQKVDSIRENFDYNELLIEDFIDKDVDEKTNDFIEDLVYFKENPIDLNKASEEDLKKIIFLSDFQIYSIVKYRKKYGNLKSYTELQYIDGFNDEIIKKLLPYVKISNVSDKKNYKNISIDFYSSSLINPDLKSIYKDTTWESNSFKNSFRLKYDHNYFKLSIKGEKDGGEGFFNKNNKYGYDFYSGYIEVFMNKFFIKKLILGDFQIKSGQGLTLWNGFKLKKSIYNTDVVDYEKGLVAYNGISEYDFFRGLAIETKHKNFESVNFISCNFLDTYSYIVDSTGENYFTSIITTGLHRSMSEIMNEKNLKLTTYGSKIKYISNHLNIGVILINNIFSKDFLPSSNLYNYFAFRGKNLLKGGIDFLINTKSIDLFGEISYNNSKLAYLLGFSKSCDYGTNFSILFRNYPVGFNTLFANPISEFSKFDNEKGLIFTFKIPVNKLIIKGICDVFYSKWLRYLINSPTYGKDLSVQFDYIFYEDNLFNINFSYSDKCNFYYRIYDRIPISYNMKNFTCKVNSILNINKVVGIKSLILFNYRISKEYLPVKSFVFSNFYNLRWLNSKNQLSTGFIYYFIPDNTVRLYYFEPLLYLNSGFKSISGKGIRFVLMYKIKSFKNWNFYLKYSQSPVYASNLHLFEFLLGYNTK